MCKRGICLLVCFVLLGLTVLSDAQADEKLPGARLKVGVIVPLSGPLAFFGKDYVRTFELYSVDHPEIAQSLDVVFEDSAYDSKKAISAFNKLITADKVDVIFSFGGPMLSVLAPLAETRQIPFFATESEKSDCESRAYCSLFRNEEDEWGRATWMMLRKHDKKKIGIFQNQNQFMNTFVNAIQRTKQGDETVTIVADVSPDTIDVRSEALALKSAPIDALGVYLLPGSHHGLMRAMSDLKQKFFLFGVEEFLFAENNKGFEDLVNGTLVVAPAVTEDYRSKFEKKYGFSAGIFYTPAFWDFLSLSSEVWTKQPGAKGKSFIDAMRFSGNKMGISGNYSVKKSAKGVFSYSFPIAVYKTENGKVSIEEIFQSGQLD